MIARCLIVFAVLFFGIGDWFSGDDGADAGRRGNALFQQEQYAPAATAYRSGLRALSDSSGLFVALQTNLGAALHQQKKFSDARTAFDTAHRTASTTEERVRALYNAGNAAAGMGDLEPALRYYRQALLLDPTYEPARHNFEVLKRELQKRQEQKRGGSPPDVEPSAYAQQLKQRAEALVARKRYADALSLMRDGLAEDSTVRAYNRFITRLQDVTGILSSPSPSSAPGATPLQSQ